MADYRISEKIVKSLFFIVPAIVLLTPIAIVIGFIAHVSYDMKYTPSFHFYESTSISSIQKALKSDEELSYLQNDEFLVSNSDSAKTYLYETLSMKTDNYEYDNKEDSALGYSYKLKISLTPEHYEYFFIYLFTDEDKIGVRRTSESSGTNLSGYIRYYQYYTGETDYLLHEVMKI